MVPVSTARSWLNENSESSSIGYICQARRSVQPSSSSYAGPEPPAATVAFVVDPLDENNDIPSSPRRTTYLIAESCRCCWLSFSVAKRINSCFLASFNPFISRKGFSMPFLRSLKCCGQCSDLSDS